MTIRGGGMMRLAISSLRSGPKETTSLYASLLKPDQAKQNRETFLAARKAAAAQREEPKTTLFDSDP